MCHNPLFGVFIVPSKLVLFQHTTLATTGGGINYSALTQPGAIWQILSDRAPNKMTSHQIKIRLGIIARFDSLLATK